eukprot:9217422-Alexandrium_andersonii.AAC.1
MGATAHRRPARGPGKASRRRRPTGAHVHRRPARGPGKASRRRMPTETACDRPHRAAARPWPGKGRGEGGPEERPTEASAA